MSISNLFQDNVYDIYSNSITSKNATVDTMTINSDLIVPDITADNATVNNLLVNNDCTIGNQLNVNGDSVIKDLECDNINCASIESLGSCTISGDIIIDDVLGGKISLNSTSGSDGKVIGYNTAEGKEEWVDITSILPGKFSSLYSIYQINSSLNYGEGTPKKINFGSSVSQGSYITKDANNTDFHVQIASFYKIEAIFQIGNVNGIHTDQILIELYKNGIGQTDYIWVTADTQSPTFVGVVYISLNQGDTIWFTSTGIGLNGPVYIVDYTSYLTFVPLF